MRSYLIYFLLLSFLSIPSSAADTSCIKSGADEICVVNGVIVVKKGGEEEKKEEKKEEPPPEPPPQAILSINVVNTSDNDATVAIKASEKITAHNMMIVQNLVAKHSNLTLGKFIAPKADTVFNFVGQSIIVNYEDRADNITCEVVKPESVNPAAPVDIKKSIDVLIFSGENKGPRCVISFDPKPKPPADDKEE